MYCLKCKFRLQEARSERRQVRQQLQEQLGVDNEAIDRIAPSLDNPYLGGAYDNDPFTTNLFLSNLSPEVSAVVFSLISLLNETAADYARGFVRKLRQLRSAGFGENYVAEIG